MKLPRWLLPLVFAAGCGASGPTVGEQCDIIGQTWCSRSQNSCKVAPLPTFGDCVILWMQSCCGDTKTCGAEAAASQSVISTCAIAIDRLPCPDVAAGKTPAVCAGIIKPR